VRSDGVEIELDPVVIVARVQGRDGWVREARHQLEEHRRLRADPIPRSRSERLLEAERRLQENLLVEREANAAYEHHRATAVTSDGRRFGARPNPYVAPELPPGKINVTIWTRATSKRAQLHAGLQRPGGRQRAPDRDRRRGDRQLPGLRHLQPMIEAAKAELEAVGVSETPGVAVADTGYWHEQQMDQVITGGTEVLIPPDAGKRGTPRRGWQADATPGCAPCSPPTMAAGSTDDAKQ